MTAKSGFDSSGIDSARAADFGFSGDRPKKSVSRPTAARTFSARPTGPRQFADRTNPLLVDAPGTPPDGFIRASTSGSEWFAYWAMARIYGDPKGGDVRNPPFYGSRDESKWKYQYPYAGGRHLPGGAVVDFVASPFNNAVLIRIQTEHFHVYTTTRKQATDILQHDVLAKYGLVVDVYDQWYMDDPTGVSCIVQMKHAIQGILPVDPLQGGTAKRTKVPKPGGRHTL